MQNFSFGGNAPVPPAGARLFPGPATPLALKNNLRITLDSKMQKKCKNTEARQKGGKEERRRVEAPPERAINNEFFQSTMVASW